MPPIPGRGSDAPATLMPPAGAYLTDGATLFHVEHALCDDARGELLLELEDCGTLETFLFPAGALAARGLRTVTPATAS